MRLAGLLRSTFRADKPDAEAVRQIKAWTLAALGATPETALAVNEIACTDPSCPGIETVILVMAPGAKTRAYKVGKALDEVTEPDIRAALV